MKFKGIKLLCLISFFSATCLANSTDWDNITYKEKELFSRILYFNNGNFSIPTEGFLLAFPNISIKSEFQILHSNLLKSPLETYCKFPARTKWLIDNSKNINFSNAKSLIAQLYKQELKEIPSICTSYLEYHQKVLVDQFEYIFASKNYISVTSMMGHGFLKASGTDIDGIIRSHAFSFFADISNTHFSTLLYDSFIGGINGAFAVKPFNRELKRYIEEEEREIWQLRLNFNEGERKFLKLIFWELKDAQPMYYFQSFNCATLILRAMGIIKPDLLFDEPLFVSPVDIFKILERHNLVDNTEVHLTESTISKYKNQNYTTVKPSTEVQDSMLGFGFRKGEAVLGFSGASHYFRTPQVGADEQTELLIGHIEVNLKNMNISRLDLYSFLNRMSAQGKWSSSFLLGARQSDYKDTNQTVFTIKGEIGKTWKLRNTSYSLLSGLGFQQRSGINAYITQLVSVKFTDRFTLTLRNENQFSQDFLLNRSELHFSKAYKKIFNSHKDLVLYAGASKHKSKNYYSEKYVRLGFDIHF